MPVPSAVELGRDIQRLKGVINKQDTEMMNVLGQGGTYGREFDTPAGNIWVGWYPCQDQIGSLVWGNLDEVRKGNYHAIYFDPYQDPPSIDLVSVTDKGTELVALPWSAIHDLFSLLNPQES